MFLVSTALRHSNIFDNHIPNDLTAVIARQQILSERRCGDLGQMLVLGDCEYLLLGQTAQADAIFQRDHEPKPMSFSFSAKLRLQWDPFL